MPHNQAQLTFKEELERHTDQDEKSFASIHAELQSINAKLDPIHQIFAEGKKWRKLVLSFAIIIATFSGVVSGIETIYHFITSIWHH